MKLPLKERVFLSAVVVVLAAVLIALAVLQYHWSTEISDAHKESLKASLYSALFNWRDGLDRELTSPLAALQAGPMIPFREKEIQYAQQYQNWSQTAPHANLVSHVFFLEAAGTERARLLQLNPTRNQFEAAEWPANLDNLHAWIRQRSAELMNRSADLKSMVRNSDRGHGTHSHGEFHLGSTSGGGGGPNHRPFGPDPVTIDLSQMVLVRPQFSHNIGRPSLGWIIVALDQKVMQEHVLPELTEHYFSGSEDHDYQVAVVASPSSSLIYSTEPGFGKQDTASLDENMPVFGPPHGPGGAKGGNPPAFLLRAPVNNRHERREMGFPGPVRIAAMPVAGADSDWQLLVRHRRGSLEAVVAGTKRRNLALSFGVLLVLAGGIAIILVSSQRARVLARLQMDFVAGVSHELRTPLAVISSAAENIADGVVAGKQQLSKYGTEIKNQARQLMQLVEEILLFAATRNKHYHYNPRPIRVEDVIDAALKDTAGTIESAGVTVEQHIAPNLPPIVGDLPALSHCLQNLITNAVKYGGDARWIGIKAGARDDQGRMEQVQISVEDKGLGIGASELRRIFEPFYRSRAAAAAQIHGTGLGLSLARDIAQAMGGSLTVSSEPGKGSRFTVCLPFADVSELQTAIQSAPATNPKLSRT